MNSAQAFVTLQLNGRLKKISYANEFYVFKNSFKNFFCRK